MKFQKVPVERLVVDSGYQRGVDANHVARIVREYDPARFGVLEVSQRNGKFAVWDGQHRLQAAAELGLDKVPCLVHTNITPEREAELFVAQRARKNIHSTEVFRARVFAGDPTAVEIDRVVREAGYKVAARSGKDAGQQFSIAGVRTLERLRKRGVLQETLALLLDLWGGDPYSTDAALIEALGIIIDGYRERLDDDAKERLRRVAPTTLLRRADAPGMGGAGGKQVALVTEIRRAAGLRGRPASRKPTEKAAA